MGFKLTLQSAPQVDRQNLVSQGRPWISPFDVSLECVSVLRLGRSIFPIWIRANFCVSNV